MALKFVDGFDSYTSTNGSEYADKWDEVDNTSNGMQWSSTGGRFGGGSFISQNTGVGTDSIRKYFIEAADETTENEVAFGFWFRSDGVATDTSNVEIITLSSRTDSSANLEINASAKRISMLQYGNGGAITGGIAYIDIFDGNWHWCEFRFKSAQSPNGISQCYIDGVLQYDVSSGDTEVTGDGTISSIALNMANIQGETYYFDDLVVYDDLGSDIKSSVDFPIGPLKIETSRPNSTGANQDFEGVGGSTTTNYLNVDESGAADDDTSYNGTETSTGAVDTFGYESLTSTGITNIIGVQLNTNGRKEGLGDMALRGVVISSASTSNGPAYPQTAAYKVGPTPLTYDPATSTFWTTAGLDAAEFGYATSSST